MEEMRKNNRQPEILAPAGSFEIMKQAFQAGADAVYLGGQAFGARAYASNLSDRELVQAIEYAGMHGKKLYLTTNTLVKESELEALRIFLRIPYEAGLHAVIVQDMGVLSMIHAEYPELELHASTQMSITTPQACQMLKELGVCRVVPARELSMQEISVIKEQGGVDIEVFVHGALCYSYSGRCLMSSLIGGRSGNRGRCAQPCRQLYKDRSGREQYLLSPKDLCALDTVPQLIEAGVDSFKIEGRMKRAEYVISAVQAYRQAVDAYMDQRVFQTEQRKQELADIFNRGGFTDGYFSMHNGKAMMCMERNNHNGICLGAVQAVQGGTVTIRLREDLNTGDVLEIRTRSGENIELTSGKTGRAGQEVILNAARLRQIRKGDPVYRTKNKQLVEALLEENEQHQLKEKVHISVILRKDLSATIKMSSDDETVTVTGGIVTTAEKQPLTEAVIREKLGKLGDAPFEIAQIKLDMDENIFFSMKEFNQLRREALSRLEKQCRERCHRSGTVLSEFPDVQKQNAEPEILEMKDCEENTQVRRLAVTIATKEQFRAAMQTEAVYRIDIELESFPDSDIANMIGQIREHGKLAYLALPHCYRQNMKERICRMFRTEADGCLLRTIDEVALWKENGRQMPAVLDYSVYTYNHETARICQEAFGCHALTLPMELNRKELEDLIMHTPEIHWEWVLYEQPAVMISAQCVYKNRDKCEKRNAAELEFFNAHGDTYIAKAVCKECYNIIYQKKPISLLDRRYDLAKIRDYRIVLTTENGSQAEKILAFRPEGNSQEGHYRKGIE